MAKDENKKKLKKEVSKPIIKKRKINIAEEEEMKIEGTASEIKKIPNRKVIFIEIDDEITTVCDRIRKLPHKNIYVVVPQRSLLFQSIVNLKILKRKAEDLDKKVFLITNDPCGVHMSQQVGLDVFNRVEKGESSDKDIKAAKHLRIRPIEATANPVRDGAPSRLAKRKMSIGELVKSIKKKKVDILPRKSKISAVRFKSKSAKDKKNKKKKTSHSRLVLIAPNRHAIVSLMIVSVMLLLTITYIALPNATVILTAKSNQIEKFVNITLADSDRNRLELEGQPTNMIASYPVSAKISQRVTHFSTGKEFKGENASGNITVINQSNRDWPLVAKTRFQTADGIVFRTPNFVTVPSKQGEEPGRVDIYVVADEVDAYDQVVGDKGNIGPSKFFLPGLNAQNQKLLYAESTQPMTGGKTNVTHFIKAEDIDVAKEKLERALKGEATAALKAQVEQKNRDQNLQLELLDSEVAIKFDGMNIEVPDNLEGQKLDEFEIFGEITAVGVAYNENEFANILKTELNSKKNPQKRLTTINTDNITKKVFDINDDSKKIKITASIKGIEEFDIHPDRENGSRLIEKIKSHVLGKKVEEAEQFIQNLPEINKVEIDSWPFWAPTMPNVPENIKIVIDQGN